MGDSNESLGFHSAAARGDVFMVRMCLKRGVAVSILDENGDTALHLASRNGRFMVVQVLLENKALINAENCEGNTALHESCLQGSLAVVKYLLEKKASVTIANKEGETPLHLTSTVEIAEVLIEHGAFVNALDYGGFTPLHYASDLETIKLLLKNKASIHIPSFYGETPVHVIVSGSIDRNKKLPIMDLFLEEGLDINVKDCLGVSLLHVAVMFADVIITQYLLDHGADVDIKDYSERTALDLAGQSRYWEQICVLYKHVLKLKLAGIEVKEDIESIVLTPEKVVEMNETTELCNLEIEKMKSAMVKESVSLYSLLLDSPKPYFLRDEQLVNSLEELMQSPSFLEEYPLYGYVLRNTLESKKQSRFYLQYLASESFSSDTRKAHWRVLPDLVRDKICDYLSDNDLQSFSNSV